MEVQTQPPPKLGIDVEHPIDVFKNANAYRAAHYDAYIADKKNRFDFGFVHIPKTGGNSVRDCVSAFSENVSRHPVHFDHWFSVRVIKHCFPQMKLAVTLRDPVERLISGFASRLRAGRPTRNVVWRANEATAFSLLRSTEEFISACLSEEIWHNSATDFAVMNIKHMRLGYSYYFESKELVQHLAPHFALLGHVEDLQPFLSAYTNSLCELKLSEKVEVPNIRSHTALSPTIEFMKSMSPKDRERLRRRFSNEYEIYEALLRLMEKQ